MSLITYPSYFCNVISLHSLVSFQSVCTLKVCYSLKKNAFNVNYTIDPPTCSLSLIIKRLLTKLVLFRWLDVNLVLFCTKQNLVNIHPLWSLTWSVTHTCMYTYRANCFKITVSGKVRMGKIVSTEFWMQLLQSFFCCRLEHKGSKASE